MARKSIGYVQLEWNCPSCGVRNIGTQRICQGCGLPQPDNVSFRKPAQDRIIEDEKLISAAKKGADIHCAYCGARNPAGSINCIQCAADLTSGKKRQAGVVLGALQTAEVPQQLCTNCKTPNPETNKTCSKCGAPLKSSSQPLPAALPKKKINPIWIILAAIVGVIICVLLAITIFSGGETSSVTGIVDSVYWERSVAIESMTQVEKKDWLTDIPAGSEVLTCSKEYHHTQDEPADDSIEVCGTPYIVDTGSGVGEQVMDCVYEVYWDYCSYTDYALSVIDTVVESGYDLNPYWPEPSITAQQQVGAKTEKYVCVFDTENGSIEYQTSSFSEFSQCQIGSTWDIEISSNGRITDLSIQY